MPWNFLFTAPLAFTAILIAGDMALAADLRLYTANKLLQQRRVSMVRNTDELGCHNLITRRRLYRVAQIGFETCTLYSKKDCEAETEISVSWKNKKEPVIAFTQGARWFLPGERGAKTASWKCEEKP
jgi:hypothetical protein